MNRIFSRDMSVRCDKCGRRMDERLVEKHEEVCNGDRRDFDGECPMCGEEYTDYLTHLRQCDAGQS